MKNPYVETLKLEFPLRRLHWNDGWPADRLREFEASLRGLLAEQDAQHTRLMLNAPGTAQQNEPDFHNRMAAWDYAYQEQVCFIMLAQSHLINVLDRLHAKA